MSLLLICGGLNLESITSWFFSLPCTEAECTQSLQKAPYTQNQLQMAKVSQSCHNGRAQKIWAEYQYLLLQMLFFFLQCLELARFPAIFLADLQM